MAVVVSDDEDTHAIAYDPIQEMIGETFEVDPPQVGFEEMIPLRPTGGVQEEAA
jgi:hypothetical protein